MFTNFLCHAPRLMCTLVLELVYVVVILLRKLKRWWPLLEPAANCYLGMLILCNHLVVEIWTKLSEYLQMNSTLNLNRAIRQYSRMQYTKASLQQFSLAVISSCWGPVPGWQIVTVNMTKSLRNPMQGENTCHHLSTMAHTLKYIQTRACFWKFAWYTS